MSGRHVLYALPRYYRDNLSGTKFEPLDASRTFRGATRLAQSPRAAVTQSPLCHQPLIRTSRRRIPWTKTSYQKPQGWLAFNHSPAGGLSIEGTRASESAGRCPSQRWIIKLIDQMFEIDRGAQYPLGDTTSRPEVGVRRRVESRDYPTTRTCPPAQSGCRHPNVSHPGSSWTAGGRRGTGTPGRPAPACVAFAGTVAPVTATPAIAAATAVLVSVPRTPDAITHTSLLTVEQTSNPAVRHSRGLESI